jgi:aminoglycoside 6'-N-acetyltransferase
MRPPALEGAEVVLRGIEQADLDELHRIVQTPEVARWWNPRTRDEIERWLGDEDVMRWTIWVDDRVVGKVQAYEDGGDEYRHAGIDVFLDPAAHGRGLGQDAVRTVARWLLEERGHHRVIIDPAHANERAIRSYEAVGFRPVGVMRRYWFDHTTGQWVDGLLMDLLAGELR